MRYLWPILFIAIGVICVISGLATAPREGYVPFEQKDTGWEFQPNTLPLSGRIAIACGLFIGIYGVLSLAEGIRNGIQTR